jgi:CheY-like chemotaxis protein
METPGPPRNLRVLIVDDDAGVRHLLAVALSRCGHAVTAAEELELAAALLEHRDFDLLCVDLDLTGLSGLEGLDLIGPARAPRPAMRIVVATGNSDPRVHRACFERGAAAVHRKGDPIAALLEIVEGVCPVERP